jgi:hypothetical protein
MYRDRLMTLPEGPSLHKIASNDVSYLGVNGAWAVLVPIYPDMISASRKRHQSEETRSII